MGDVALKGVVDTKEISRLHSQLSMKFILESRSGGLVFSG